MFSASANSASLSIAEIATFSRRPSRAVPPLPGATKTFCTRGLCARRHATACSLPPEPMTRSFMDQCRKCRTPVNTIASPSSLAAAITSSSRTLPPGWMTAFAPARATTSTPSRNGKNASDATTDPSRDTPVSCALSAAIRAASTRLICPAPGKQQIGDLRLCGPEFGDGAKVRRMHVACVGRLHQQPASDAFEVVRLRGVRKPYRQHPHVGFGGKDPSCFGVELWRDHHLDELFGYRCSRRGVG